MTLRPRATPHRPAALRQAALGPAGVDRVPRRVPEVRPDSVPGRDLAAALVAQVHGQSHRPRSVRQTAVDRERVEEQDVALRHRRVAEVGLVEVTVDGERPGPERHLATSAVGLGRIVALYHR